MYKFWQRNITLVEMPSSKVSYHTFDGTTICGVRVGKHLQLERPPYIFHGTLRWHNEALYFEKEIVLISEQGQLMIASESPTKQITKQRSHPRLSVILPAQLQTALGDSHSVTVTQISEGGLIFKSKNAIAHQSKQIQMQMLTNSGEAVIVQGKLKGLRSPVTSWSVAYGLEFGEVPAKTRERLKTLIAQA